MRATFTDEQRALAETARGLAAGGLTAARRTLDGGEAPAGLNEQLFAGFAGVGVREEDGGSGGGMVDLAIVLEALGRTLTPTPFVSHVVAVQAAVAAGIEVGPALSSGHRWSIADDERGRGWEELQTRVDERVTGTKIAVRDGDRCDAAVVLAADDLVAVAVPGRREQRTPADTTRPLADLTFDDVPTATGRGVAAAALRAAALVAAEQVGVGRGALDLAVAYVGEREQFGQPVGRFQAVAHQLADAFVALESAWSLVLYACWAVDDGAAAAAPAVSAAKAKAGEAAVFAAERATQVHGGIGITWEADLHLFLRRALADDAWLGSSRRHRRLLGGQLVAAARADG